VRLKSKQLIFKVIYLRTASCPVAFLLGYLQPRGWTVSQPRLLAPLPQDGDHPVSVCRWPPDHLSSKKKARLCDVGQRVCVLGPSAALSTFGQRSIVPAMKGKSAPQKRKSEHTQQWEHMRAHLAAWVVEFASWPGNAVDASEFDNRVRPYADTDVCARCKTDAALVIQERLKSYHKTFVNRETSPYLSRPGPGGGHCTCKRTVHPYR
jgi:hypothetical protein